jgi:hypothetical protein
MFVHKFSVDEEYFMFRVVTYAALPQQFNGVNILTLHAATPT